MEEPLLFRKDIPNATLQSKYCRASTALATNTKARRLGYLVMMLGLFKDSDHYPVSHFGIRVEAEAENINRYLDLYRNSRGKIEHKGQSGSSAGPYIDLAEDLSLIVEINRSFILSKQSKVYRVILNQIDREGLGADIIASRIDTNDRERQIGMFDDKPSRNPFRLNLFQQTFFLHHILSADSLYFWTLIEIIGSNDAQTERNIRDRFQKTILMELERQVGASITPNDEKRKILEVLQRVRRWEKPEVYLEHIVVPRLNWMLDLDILDSQAFAHGVMRLSQVGNRLLALFDEFFTAYNEKSNLCCYLLDEYYFRILDRIYKLGYQRESEIEYSTYLQYVTESFRYFKTAAPDSISAAQTIFYICYKSLLRDKKVVEFADMKNRLADSFSAGYRLEWYNRENDGALQRRK